MKRTITAFLAWMMCLVLLTGCGAAGASAPASDQKNFEETAASGETGFDGKSEAALRPEEARKIIYNADLSLESKQFGKSQEAILTAAQNARAYVQQSEEGGSEEKGSRWVKYTFRVPSDHYNEFLNGACGAGNLVSKRESTEDVTSEYVDVEARLESLRTQEQRLIELSAKAETLEDLMAIENQLTEVRYQIESYTGKKNVMDSLIQYSTVSVELWEVDTLTPQSPSFGSRLVDAFYGSWKGFAKRLQDLVILLVYWLPSLVVLGILAAILIPILRRNHKKRVAQNLNRLQNPAAPTQANGEKQPAKYDQHP